MVQDVFKSMGYEVDIDRRAVPRRNPDDAAPEPWRMDRGEPPTGRTSIRSVDGVLSRRRRPDRPVAGLRGLRHLGARGRDGPAVPRSVTSGGPSHVGAPAGRVVHGHDAHGRGAKRKTWP